MHRRDFELIAGVLRELRTNPPPHFTAAHHEVVSKRFAEAVKGLNPGFDHDRFLRAAGVNLKG